MDIQSLHNDDCVDEVIEKYSHMVYRLAFSHMKTKQDAEYVFQDVFLKYISKPRNFENEEHRKAWLIRVTMNRCKSLWSSSWFKKTEQLDEKIVFAAKDEIELYEYLKLLPKKYISVLHLFYYEDLPVKQISEIMSAKESTVRTWLTRARAMLKENMKGDFFDE